MARAISQALFPPRIKPKLLAEAMEYVPAAPDVTIPAFKVNVCGPVVPVKVVLAPLLIVSVPTVGLVSTETERLAAPDGKATSAPDPGTELPTQFPPVFQFALEAPLQFTAQRDVGDRANRITAKKRGNHDWLVKGQLLFMAVLGFSGLGSGINFHSSAGSEC